MIKQSFGCTHYKRKCKILPDCCEKEFSCRICHDEYFESKQIVHKVYPENVNKIICIDCNTKQDISNNCINCNVQFGNYYCEKCRLFDYVDKKQFHCDKCGICRVGGAENYFHCETCNACINIALKDNHVCIKNCFQSCCPICYENIFDSVKPITKIKCGHTIHVECFSQMLKSGSFSNLRCPLCNKSAIDCTQIFNNLENEIQNTPMPEQYNFNVKIYCNDCEKNSETKFHILGHKCQHCGSFNTKR